MSGVGRTIVVQTCGKTWHVPIILIWIKDLRMISHIFALFVVVDHSIAPLIGLEAAAQISPSLGPVQG